MALNLISYDHAEDDYIDMEVSSFSTFLCNSITSPSHPREFEFQMSSGPLVREPTTSPADELFYKGKLLPLHLPPRLQMVEKLLQNPDSAFDIRKSSFEEFYSTPLTATAAPTPTTSTPFESCNVSPSESCQVSCELNPEEYFLQYSTELSGFIGANPKKSWTRKLKLIKQSSLSSKLKASRAYLKSFFGKSGCTDETCAADAKESLSKHVATTKKNTFGQVQNTFQRSATGMRNFDKEKITQDGGRHRRSFSVSIKRHSTNKSSPASSSSSSGSSSSSCSNNSNGVREVKYLKRSSSSKSEMESPIQGAIAHCKQSQQMFHSRKTLSEVGFYSLSAARISVCEDQERPELSRG